MYILLFSSTVLIVSQFGPTERRSSTMYSRNTVLPFAALVLPSLKTVSVFRFVSWCSVGYESTDSTKMITVNLRGASHAYCQMYFFCPSSPAVGGCIT